MSDLSVHFFGTGVLDEPAEYISVGSSTPFPLQVIFRENYEISQESGKGLTRSVRSSDGDHAMILVRAVDVSSPVIGDVVRIDSKDFLVKSVKKKRSGMFVLKASASSHYRGPIAGQTER